VLQALAKKKLLRVFDYVSTVSGGGYIGGCWLVAWMHHQGIGIKDIEERLSAPPNLPGEAGDLPEVHFLRDYSLPDARKRIPEGGLLGVCTSYLRDTTLHQIILVLALLALLLVPRTIVYAYSSRSVTIGSTSVVRHTTKAMTSPLSRVILDWTEWTKLRS